MGRTLALGPGGAIDPGTYVGPDRQYPVRYDTIPNDFGFRHPDVPLSIERDPGSGVFVPGGVVRWSFVERAKDGADTIAQLVVPALNAEKLTGAASIGREHFAHIIRRLGPDVRVRIGIVQGATAAPVPLFEGYPQPITLTWDQGGQAVAVQAICAGQERIRTGATQQIGGRIIRGDPLTAWKPSEPDTVPDSGLSPVFNPKHPKTGKVVANRSAEALPITVDGASYQAHLFTSDGEPGAQLWTYADAWRYLAVWYCLTAGKPIEVGRFLRDTDGDEWSVPSPTSPDPLARFLTARPTDLPVGGLNLDEAFALLASRSGVSYAIDVDVDGSGASSPWVHRLRVWAPITDPNFDAGAPDNEMGRPGVFDIPREAPNTNHVGRSPSVVAQANAAVSAAITIDPRSITAPWFLGGRKRYEVTLLLRPGWTPYPTLDDVFADTDPDTSEDPNAQTKQKKIDAAVAIWRSELEVEWEAGADRVPVSKFHRLHPLHDTVRDVMRLWIFPDSTEYAGKGYGRSENRAAGWLEKYYSPFVTPDDPEASAFLSIFADSNVGGGIAFADVLRWSPRRRPFLDTIGRQNRATTSRAPVVRFNFSAASPAAALADPNWSDFGGIVDLDPLRGAIYFADDNIWWPNPHFAADPEHDPTGANWITAYIAGTFWVSITCTIEGDRLEAFERAAASRRDRSQIIDTGSAFEYANRRGQNSHYNAQPTDIADFEGVDDSDELDAFAKREAALMARDVVSGDPELFYIAHRYRVGDTFRGVSGLGIAFASYPEVLRVRYMRDEGAGFRTILHTEDLRNAPEVGSE